MRDMEATFLNLSSPDGQPIPPASSVQALRPPRAYARFQTSERRVPGPVYKIILSSFPHDFRISQKLHTTAAWPGTPGPRKSVHGWPQSQLQARVIAASVKVIKAG
ncbi:hypothetical protein CLCR_11055 [Cladophialophora carrionii]|uniref:Uncharacterized protein n=1 Tax=Cladophialophora carrionii TaxID=86049 RepID=A0A1C1CVZ0_9EURO|nr:hypothetical protein CLCR_11055 [Cladophialophora carrionii]